MSASELPSDVGRARNRFQAWRARRVRGSRIPRALWGLAVRLAKRHGISRTVGVLGVDYYSLKKQVEASAGALPSARDSAFVELPSPLMVGKGVRSARRRLVFLVLESPLLPECVRRVKQQTIKDIGVILLVFAVLRIGDFGDQQLVEDKAGNGPLRCGSAMPSLLQQELEAPTMDEPVTALLRPRIVHAFAVLVHEFLFEGLYLAEDLRRISLRSSNQVVGWRGIPGFCVGGGGWRLDVRPRVSDWPRKRIVVILWFELVRHGLRSPVAGTIQAGTAPGEVDKRQPGCRRIATSVGPTSYYSTPSAAYRVGFSPA